MTSSDPRATDLPGPVGGRTPDGRGRTPRHPSSGHPPTPHDLVGFLGSTELFRTLDPPALRQVAEAVDRVAVPGGADVCRQGQPGGDLFLVASGRLRVLFTDGDGRERVVREVARGENFGEIALLTGEPRSATVRAIRDTVLVRLTRQAFERLITDHPAAMRSLTRMLARWLVRSNEQRQPPRLPTTLAVRAASPEVPLVAFCRHLREALEDVGPTLHLRAESVDRALYPGAAVEEEGAEGYPRVTRWLGDQEAAHQFVLYEAGRGSDAWARRCARQADRLLTVVWGPGDPARAPFAEPPPGSAPPSHLVLLHPPGTARPAGTVRWGPDRYDAHHHVRLDRPGHFGRLARHLTGRAVGLVLGGGGARGFAHIGVVRAMREKGVPVDRIGGTSIGAVVGALVAMGLEPDTVVGMIRDSWTAVRPEKDYTLPLVSLLAGRRGKRLCTAMFGDVALEDLWIPFFCCSASLTRSELVVHHQGPLWRQILSSVAIPGIAPPVVDDRGELLVDGGVLNNVPADVMAATGAGSVVAVDVSQREDLSLEAWGGSLPSSREILANFLSPFTPRRHYPNIFHILVRSSTLSSTREAQRMRDRVDLYIEPPVGGYDLFAWEAVEEIAGVGYRHALERLEGWPGPRALDPSGDTAG